MHIKLLFSIVFMLTSVLSFAQDSVYSSINLDKNLKKNSNVIIRSDDLDVTIESQDRMRISQNSVITILNDKGNEDFKFVIGYDKYNKIKKIEATIYDEMGVELKKFKKRDFVDVSAVDGGTLYSDSRMLFLPYTPIMYPYTVHFKCEIETSNTGNIPSWNPIKGYYVSAEKISYSVIDNAGIGIHFKEKNLNKFEIDSDNSSNSINYSLENFIAVKPEDLSPSLNSIMPRVMVRAYKFHFYGVDGEANDWVEFGDWMVNSLLKGRNEISQVTKNKVLDLVSSAESNIEKAKLIYHYVQNNTRYISVQVGIGGVQPISAMEVDMLKYGDCKGLTNYTSSLLEVAGIPSFYTVVEAGNELIDFEEDFPSIEQGNHIILGIPDETEIVWIDCTSQLHPFGFIGDFTDNRKVLIISKGESKIIKTAKYINSDNHQLTKGMINLQTDGSFTSSLKIKTKGLQYDSRFQLERQSNQVINEYYKNIWGELMDLAIKEYEFNNNKEDIIFTENLELGARNYAMISGGKYIFQPNVFNRSNFIPKRYKNRQFGIEIKRGYFDEDEYKFAIPDGYIVEFLPQDISVNNNYGDYEVNYQIKDGFIVYKRKLLIKKGTFSKTEYENYRDFRKKISKSDKSKIILNKIQ